MTNYRHVFTAAHQPFSVRELHPAWLMFLQIPHRHESAFPTNTHTNKFCITHLYIQKTNNFSMWLH